jgi:NAD(P)-dependent dehydrogenase (short-subunit alcohol dehydrogenase family)
MGGRERGERGKEGEGEREREGKGVFFILIIGTGANVHYIVNDAASTSDRKALVDKVTTDFPSLNAVILNAGNSPPLSSPPLSSPPSPPLSYPLVSFALLLHADSVQLISFVSSYFHFFVSLVSLV